MRPPQTIQNAFPGSRAFCPHCTNSGMVILDEPGMVGAPCPMCKKGAMIDVAGTSLRYDKHGSGSAATTKAVGTGEGAGFWRDVSDDVTWERGLSVRHVRRCQFAREGDAWPCGRPAVGQWCDHHHESEHRRGAAPVSAAGLVRRAGAVIA